jgi:CheY-like chemotaxis protein
MQLLLVEDDGFYAQTVAESLQDSGFAVLVTHTVQDALSQNLEGCDGAVIDVMLPNDPDITGISVEESRGGYASGVALARRLKQRYPAIRLLLLSGDVVGTDAAIWAENQDIPFVRKADGALALLGGLERLGLLANPPTPKAFIVHGHDEATLADLKKYIVDNLKWQLPIVLREQASAGRTIIEKFEQWAARVDCVFVLLTPDDIAIGPLDNDAKRRSRQNVIFELGFFYAQFGRTSGRVIALHRGPIDLPSDIQGIVWIDVGSGVMNADEVIRREVTSFGSRSY